MHDYSIDISSYLSGLKHVRDTYRRLQEKSYGETNYLKGFFYCENMKKVDKFNGVYRIFPSCRDGLQWAKEFILFLANISKSVSFL